MVPVYPKKSEGYCFKQWREKKKFWMCDTKCVEGFCSKAEHGDFIMKVPAHPELYST